MKPEKDKQLCEKYPALFKDRNDQGSRAPISYGIECGDGWYDLLDALCGCIQLEVSNLSHGKSPEVVEELQPRITQIKEKFGGLRFYTTTTTEKIYGMIALAESMSYKICESCGVPGTKRNAGWIRVTCDACEEQRKSRRFMSNDGA